MRSGFCIVDTKHGFIVDVRQSESREGARARVCEGIPFPLFIVGHQFFDPGTYQYVRDNPIVIQSIKLMPLANVNFWRSGNHAIEYMNVEY